MPHIFEGKGIGHQIQCTGGVRTLRSIRGRSVCAGLAAGCRTIRSRAVCAGAVRAIRSGLGAICGRPVAALGLGTVPLRSRAFDQQTNGCREHHCHNEKHHRDCQSPLPVQTQKNKEKNCQHCCCHGPQLPFVHLRCMDEASDICQQAEQERCQKCHRRCPVPHLNGHHAPKEEQHRRDQSQHTDACAFLEHTGQHRPVHKPQGSQDTQYAQPQSGSREPRPSASSSSCSSAMILLTAPRSAAATVSLTAHLIFTPSLFQTPQGFCSTSILPHSPPSE